MILLDRNSTTFITVLTELSQAKEDMELVLIESIGTAEELMGPLVATALGDIEIGVAVETKPLETWAGLAQSLHGAATAKAAEAAAIRHPPERGPGLALSGRALDKFVRTAEPKAVKLDALAVAYAAAADNLEHSRIAVSDAREALAAHEASAPSP